MILIQRGVGKGCGLGSDSSHYSLNQMVDDSENRFALCRSVLFKTTRQYCVAYMYRLTNKLN